jgi:glycerol-3-phosphate dehydrogenase
VTRDYVLELDTSGPPLLSVFGGKITTARHLAEEAVERLAAATGWKVKPVTGDALLPGGDLQGDFEGFLLRARKKWPFLGSARSERMARAYGNLLLQMLARVESPDDMGEDFGGGLCAVEVDWLVDQEWAQTAEDILTRRTKIGLATGADVVERLDRFLSSRQLKQVGIEA